MLNYLLTTTDYDADGRHIYAEDDITLLMNLDDAALAEMFSNPYQAGGIDKRPRWIILLEDLKERVPRWIDSAKETALNMAKAIGYDEAYA